MLWQDVNDFFLFLSYEGLGFYGAGGPYEYFLAQLDSLLGAAREAVGESPVSSTVEGIDSDLLGTTVESQFVTRINGSHFVYGASVPISAAAWLFGSALIGMGVVRRQLWPCFKNQGVFMGVLQSHNC